MALIGLYLVAIIAANILVATFGPSVSIANAFLFIGLDLTARDALHERWHGRHLWRNMALLILSGSAISAALDWQAAPIALASSIAFGLAGLADAVVYHLLRQWSWLWKANGSNVVSSAVDSLAFPAIAFGFPLLFGIMAGQFAAKMLGGLLWSLILHKAKGATLGEAGGGFGSTPAELQR